LARPSTAAPLPTGKHCLAVCFRCLANFRFPKAAMWRRVCCGASTPAPVRTRPAPVSPRLPSSCPCPCPGILMVYCEQVLPPHTAMAISSLAPAGVRDRAVARAGSEGLDGSHGEMSFCDSHPVLAIQEVSPSTKPHSQFVDLVSLMFDNFRLDILEVQVNLPRDLGGLTCMAPCVECSRAFLTVGIVLC
jgi:hypothetical protein